MDNDLIVRYNDLIDRVARGLDHATLALNLQDSEEKVAELSDLVGDLEDELDLLKYVCIVHGWNPDSIANSAAEVE